MSPLTRPRTTSTWPANGVIGCFTCKSRHIRCDEKKPICSHCERLKLQCRPSEFIAPSSWSVTVGSPRQAEAQNPNATSIGGDAPIFEPPTSTYDIFQSQMPSWQLDVTPPKSTSTPSSPHPQFSSRSCPKLNSEVTFLINTYRTGVATWMDLFDHACTYQRAIMRRVLDSSLLLRCLCAFTARHLSLLPCGEIWGPVAERYYGESLRLLIDLLGSQEPQDDALTATILLSSYEVISSEGHEHQKHCFGAMMLIRSHGICARSVGIDRANFWIYVRHEIVVALVTERPLLISPSEWNVSWVDEGLEEDMLGNHMLWLVARAIDMVYAEDAGMQEGLATEDQRNSLLEEVELWYERWPGISRGIPYGETTEEGFSKLFFAIPAAAASMMWYHFIHILLYAETSLQNPTLSQQVQHHANQIATIGVSDITDTVRSFGQQPLYFAAKHIDGIAKKARIWALLDDIEVRLGFHTRYRVKRLQEMVQGKLQP